MSKKEDIQLYKKVRKVHLSEILPDYNKFPPGFTHAIVNSDNSILNFCSERYKLELNKDIFKPIEIELDKVGLPYERKVNIINGAKFYVDYIIKDRKVTPSINDILPKISISNSYDGVIKKRIDMGFHKLICQNGLTAPSKQWQEIWRKHTDDSKGSNLFSLEVISSVDVFLQDVPNEMRVFETMNTQKVKDNFLKEMADANNFSKRMFEIAKERFDLEVGGGISYINEHGETVNHDGSPRTIFTAYNALNYAIFHSNDKELPEKKLEKDRKLLSSMILQP